MTWSRRDLAILAAVLGAGTLVRLALLPTQGFRYDLDVFAEWTHGIAVAGLAHAYDGSLNFGPVMAFTFAAIAAVEPTFRLLADASDDRARMLLKLPAVLGDAAMVAMLVWLLRRVPRWAIVAAAGIALNPAIVLLSAWWGQYESVYTAFALLGVVLAVEGRLAVGGAAVALSVMTKPQGAPFVLPYLAWTLGRGGIRRVALASAAFVATCLVVWAPFIAAGGVGNFIATLRSLQDGSYNVITLNAWNAWASLQGFVRPFGLAIPDTMLVLGPVSARLLGMAVAGIASLVLAFGTARRPSRAALVVAMAAQALIAFAFLTTMHERYVYPLVVLPLPLVWWRPMRIAWLAFSVGFLLELLWAVQIEPFAGIGVPLDILRVPAALLVVGAAIEFVWLVLRGRLPDDDAWDRAVGAAASTSGLSGPAVGS